MCSLSCPISLLAWADPFRSMEVQNGSTEVSSKGVESMLSDKAGLVGVQIGSRELSVSNEVAFESC